MAIAQRIRVLLLMIEILHELMHQNYRICGGSMWGHAGFLSSTDVMVLLSLVSFGFFPKSLAGDPV